MKIYFQARQSFIKGTLKEEHLYMNFEDLLLEFNLDWFRRSYYKRLNPWKPNKYKWEHMIAQLFPSNHPFYVFLSQIYSKKL